MIFLQSCGISTILASRIYGLYGGKAAASIRPPLASCRRGARIGFASADAIARNLGVAPGSPHRTEAGLQFALQQKVEEGNTWAPRGELVDAAARLAGQVPAACKAAVDSLAARGAMSRHVRPPNRPSLPSPHFRERRCGAAHRASGRRKSSAPRRGRDAADSPSKDARGITLSSRQREAVRAALRSRILVITGGPKRHTTLITAIVDALTRRGERVVLCAPTGRAAKRMQEVGRQGGAAADSPAAGVEYPEGRLPARRAFPPLLRHPLSWTRCPWSTSPFSPACWRPCRPGRGRSWWETPTSCPPWARQRPCRPGRLRRSRGAADGDLPPGGRVHRGQRAPINAGAMPAAPRRRRGFLLHRDGGARGHPRDDQGDCGYRIPRRFSLDPRRDIQVLTPMHKGPVGAMNLNRELQDLLNPRGPGARARGRAVPPV